MSVFKCKMCGGTIEFEPGSTVGVCEYCGTKQTLPKLDDDKKANLYDRANHFRRSNDFDKAANIYEQILAEDNTDSEAYWSLVLCRYGIEYVEDPTTHSRIPTVNRAQFTSIYADEDYKSAIEYADNYQKEIYELEAKQIDEIQKGILAISNKEEPFDIFICYKETDNNGRRTIDSVLANDLYHQLVQEGFKVFFSRITLEDKLGTAYEPYIFAALNSSKVMVVLGTKPEYFNAVWVKNEWSRYLSLVKQSKGKKVLIPAYRDMDPYDLPEEFSHLQALDMSKLGFMQDLIRGIKKIIQTDTSTPTIKETIITNNNNPNSNVNSLLKRVSLFLEDGNFKEANEYCEKVLDIDPENAYAYLGKLMVELQVRKQESLKDQAQPFDDNSNYQKVIRFADKKLSSTLSGYISYINERNENTRLTNIYDNAVAIMDTADKQKNEKPSVSKELYKEAATIFESIIDFKDSDTLSKKCYEEFENCHKESIYKSAILVMSIAEVAPLEEAIKSFQSIPGWKDSDEQMLACQKKIEEIKAKEEAEHQQAKLNAEKAAKKRKKTIAITIPIICIIVGFIFVLNNTIIPNSKYNNAIKLKESGEYDQAIIVFEELNDYKDSKEQVNDCTYETAIELKENGKYEDAITIFKEIENYKDSKNQIKDCETMIKDIKYDNAIVLKKAGKFDEAITAFEEIENYKDSKNQIAEVRLLRTKEQLKNVEVGSYIEFGSYEQDNNSSNGKEDIEWKVLDTKDGKALVISRYGLDCQPYNTEDEDVTWKTCSLRNWLNETFYDNAFSSEEQSIIVNSIVTADKNPEYGTNPGNNTTDKIFLLSVTEVKEYFFIKALCKPTEYAVAKGAYEYDDGFCYWWLRSPGERQNIAAFVTFTKDGYKYFYCDSAYVDASYVCVRPALWIDLES